MDFIVRLLRISSGYGSIWVIVDQLMKSTHFLPVKTTYRATQLAKLYVDRIVYFCEVSDRRPQFTLQFSHTLQEK